MNNISRTAVAVVLLMAGFSVMPAHADAPGSSAHNAAAHAPIGVMGDHMHEKGEFMLSYRFMHMNMQGNRAGTDSLDADTIVTKVPNRFFRQAHAAPHPAYRAC